MRDAAHIGIAVRNKISCFRRASRHRIINFLTNQPTIHFHFTFRRCSALLLCRFLSFILRRSIVTKNVEKRI